MEAGDAHAFAEVEGVGFLAVGSGVEAEGLAAGLAGVVLEPIEQSFAVAAGSARLIGYKVIDVEGAPGGEDFCDAKSGDRDDCAFVVKIGEKVALRLLGVDAIDELLGQ